MIKNKNKYSVFLSLLFTALMTPAALAQIMNNNFFGANPGNVPTTTPAAAAAASGNSNSSGDIDENNVNAGLPGLSTQPTPPPSGSYTDDEKRMQRKYKSNIANAKHLIDRGEDMMKSAGQDDKVYKKGKILKEIGEKTLAELQANDPFANGKDKLTDEPKKDTKDTKDSAKK